MIIKLMDHYYTTFPMRAKNNTIKSTYIHRIKCKENIKSPAEICET